jgi:hypothetical protein
LIALASALALTAIAVATASFVRCAGGLEEVREPDGWRMLPEEEPYQSETKRLGPFVFASHVANPKYGHGHEDARLYDPALCPSDGVSLTRWFTTGRRPDTRLPTSLHLQHDSDTFIVSGTDQEVERQFVVAFRRVRAGRIRATSPERAALLGMIGLAAATAGITAVRARRGDDPVATARNGLILIAALAVVTAMAALYLAVMGELSTFM